jgi:hypothetical protein
LLPTISPLRDVMGIFRYDEPRHPRHV